jgi:hypothetical protein
MVGIVCIQTVLERRLRSSDQRNFHFMTTTLENLGRKRSNLILGANPVFGFFVHFPILLCRADPPMLSDGTLGMRSWRWPSHHFGKVLGNEGKKWAKKFTKHHS